mmetsp:Transcript_974/g.2504  ORF Transcript_974/g.2504 Transcript_974/m.2504 type:complete len:345 (-) Transcript_974:240-1274(-)
MSGDTEVRCKKTTFSHRLAPEEWVMLVAAWLPNVQAGVVPGQTTARSGRRQDTETQLTPQLLVSVADVLDEAVAASDLDHKLHVHAGCDCPVLDLVQQSNGLVHHVPCHFPQRAQLEAQRRVLAGAQHVVLRVHARRGHRALVLVDDIPIQINVVRLHVDLAHADHLRQRVDHAHMGGHTIARDIAQRNDVGGECGQDAHGHRGDPDVDREARGRQLHEPRLRAEVSDAHGQRRKTLTNGRKTLLVADVCADKPLEDLLVVFVLLHDRRRNLIALSRRQLEWGPQSQRSQHRRRQRLFDLAANVKQVEPQFVPHDDRDRRGVKHLRIRDDAQLTRRPVDGHELV